MDREHLAAIVTDQLAAVVAANRRRRAALDGNGPASTALVAADAIMLAADQYAALVADQVATHVLLTYIKVSEMAAQVLDGPPGDGAAP